MGEPLSFWRDRRVFVTGGSGLLGASLVEELVAQGAQPVCLIRDWVPQSHLLAGDLLDTVVVVRGELEDHDVLLRAMNEHETDTVFHLGAQTIVGTAGRSAMSTFEANIRGTWNLLEAARTLGNHVQRVVVASSDKAYGEHDNLPYTEDTPLQGRFPYDASKSCTDLISMSYFHSYGVPVSITRCGNLFGAGDLNWSRLIPGTIRSALKGERPIVRSDGQYTRDYFYVKDAVHAYMTLAEQMPGEDTTGEAFNFGTETPMTVLEVVDAILAAMDRTDLVPDIRNEASREIRAQYLNCDKAGSRLGWSSKYGFDAGLAETIAWYRQHLT